MLVQEEETVSCNMFTRFLFGLTCYRRLIRYIIYVLKSEINVVSKEAERVKTRTTTHVGNN